MSTPLYESTLKSLPLLGRGKVRDNYALGADKLLIVTTDRLSAFDVVLPGPINGKGRVLTELTVLGVGLEALLGAVAEHSVDRMAVLEKMAGLGLDPPGLPVAREEVAVSVVHFAAKVGPRRRGTGARGPRWRRVGPLLSSGLSGERRRRGDAMRAPMAR